MDGCLCICHFFRYIVPPLRQRSILLIFVHFLMLYSIKEKWVPAPYNPFCPQQPEYFFQKHNWDYAAPLPKPSSDFPLHWSQIHPLPSVHKSRMIWPLPASPTHTDHLKSLFLPEGLWLGVLCLDSDPSALRGAHFFLSLRPQLSCHLFRETFVTLHLE